MNREEATRFGEKLRCRDILHHVTDQIKFTDSSHLYRMRAAEGPADPSLGPPVTQLLGQSRYMVGAWFLKQVCALWRVRLVLPPVPLNDCRVQQSRRRAPPTRSRLSLSPMLRCL